MASSGASEVSDEEMEMHRHQPFDHEVQHIIDDMPVLSDDVAAAQPALSPPSDETTTQPPHQGQEHLTALLNALGNRVVRTAGDGGGRETEALQEVRRLTTIEVQQVVDLVIRLVPFILLLILYAALHYVWQILAYVWLVGVTEMFNSSIKRNASDSPGLQSSVVLLLRMMLTYGSALYFAVWWLPDECRDIASVLLMMPSGHARSFGQCVATVLLADAVSTSILAMSKATLFVASSLVTRVSRRRTQMLIIFEALGRLYRTLLPLFVWPAYFAGDPATFFSLVLAGMYLSIKFQSVAAESRSLLQSLRWREIPYGRIASSEEIAEVGGECPICRDAFVEPLQLDDCGHVFCKACIHHWLSRERTCPMCRRPIANAGSHLYADGSTSWVPSLV